MLPLVPLPYKLGAIALAVALVGASGFVAGRKSLRDQMNALKQSYEAAAAQAAGREAERVRQWTNAAIVAGEKYSERAKIADASFDSSLDRLRSAYASVKGVRFAAPSSGECPAASGPTAGDILKQGEALAGILREADLTAAALASCVAAWPR